MAGVDYWEAQFIQRFIVADKQERYLSLLKGRKRRAKFLDELNHNLAYDKTKARILEEKYKEPENLLSLLASMQLGATCYLVADSNSVDRKELTIELAVPELLNNHFGALMICPPKPVVLYKEEDIGDLIPLADACSPPTQFESSTSKV